MIYLDPEPNDDGPVLPPESSEDDFGETEIEDADLL